MKYEYEDNIIEFSNFCGREEEERSLIRAAQSGNKAAEDRLVQDNQRLVYSLAAKYNKKDSILDLQDLAQEGFIGLLTAIHKFDPNAGAKLSTYAYHWIKARILKALETQENTIRVPYYASETVEQPLSLDLPVGDDESSRLADFVSDRGEASPESIVANAYLGDSLKAAMEELLSPKEAELLSLRFGLGDGRSRTLEEISGVFGLSRERTVRICERALQKLKYGASYLCDYFAA